MNPPLAALRHLVTVVSEGSFTRAAAVLHLSQPALSRSIVQLERDAGVPLLRRTTRSVEPTAEGLELETTARAILAAYDDGLGRFGAYLAGLRGRVTVAALPSLAAGVLPRHVAAFARTHPDVEVRIREGLDHEVRRWIEDGTADLGVSDSGEQSPDLVSIPLGDDPMVAVFHPESDLATRTEVTWQALAERPFIAFAPGSSVRRLTESGFTAAGARPSQQLEAVAIATVAGMLGARLGVTAVPSTVVPLMTFTPLERRPIVGPSIVRGISLHARRAPALAPAARELAKRLGAIRLPER